MPGLPVLAMTQVKSLSKPDELRAAQTAEDRASAPPAMRNRARVDE